MTRLVHSPSLYHGKTYQAPFPRTHHYQCQKVQPEAACPPSSGCQERWLGFHWKHKTRVTFHFTVPLCSGTWHRAGVSSARIHQKYATSFMFDWGDYWMVILFWQLTLTQKRNQQAQCKGPQHYPRNPYFTTWLPLSTSLFQLISKKVGWIVGCHWFVILHVMTQKAWGEEETCDWYQAFYLN